MIEIEVLEYSGVIPAITGMRNAFNSHDAMDSVKKEFGVSVGTEDKNLMNKLMAAGPSHRKYLRVMDVCLTVRAPRNWWIEFDTYKIGVTTSSEGSTNILRKRPYELGDFSTDSLSEVGLKHLLSTIELMNDLRARWLETKNVDLLIEIYRLRPESYMQKRTFKANYEALGKMYDERNKHTLPEWRSFCAAMVSFDNGELLAYDRKES